jgi:hypothetical protein
LNTCVLFAICIIASQRHKFALLEFQDAPILVESN